MRASMKVISVAIQKGGTGKTSLSVSTAVELAKMGKTLIIDADPQGNATDWLGVKEIRTELSDLLQAEDNTREQILNAVLPTFADNLFVIPTAGIGGGLNNWQKYGANDDPKAITRLLRQIKTDFDFCVIDTSPSFGGLETSCFLASHETVTVLKIDEFSADGLTLFFDNLQKMKRRHDTDLPELTKIVLNARDYRLVQQAHLVDVIQKMAVKSNKKIYIIPIEQSFPKAQQLHIPIQKLDSTKKETLKVIKELANDLAAEE